MKETKEEFLQALQFKWSKCDWNQSCWRLEALYGGIPIGIVWLTLINVTTIQRGKKVFKRTAEVFQSYVVEKQRRKGVRTSMQKEILKVTDIVRSGGVSKAAVAFMKKEGYKYVPAVNEYVFNKK